MKQPTVLNYVPVVLRPTLSILNLKFQDKCSNEATLYAECVKNKGLEVQERECQHNFTALMNCIKKINRN